MERAAAVPALRAAAAADHVIQWPDGSTQFQTRRYEELEDAKTTKTRRHDEHDDNDDTMRNITECHRARRVIVLRMSSRLRALRVFALKTAATADIQRSRQPVLTQKSRRIVRPNSRGGLVPVLLAGVVGTMYRAAVVFVRRRLSTPGTFGSSWNVKFVSRVVN